MCAYKWAICVQEAIEGRKHPYVNSTHTNIVNDSKVGSICFHMIPKRSGGTQTCLFGNKIVTKEESHERVWLWCAWTMVSCICRLSYFALLLS